MHKHQLAISGVVAALLAAAAIAGCGGGGGYSAAAPPPPGPSPSPSPTPALQGNLNATTGGTYPNFSTAPAASINAVFSCGCSAQAGITTTNATGDFSVMSPATATPAVPSPTYTIVPGRNYIVIAEPASLAGPQAWTMLYAKHIPADDLALDSSGATPAPWSSTTSDVYTAAAALYIYFKSPGGSGTAFDAWNINTVNKFAHNLRLAPNAAEITLLNDIATKGSTSSSLFPAAPSWNPSQPTASKIHTDLTAVEASGDMSIPTPCPGNVQSGCKGTPTP